MSVLSARAPGRHRRAQTEPPTPLQAPPFSGGGRRRRVRPEGRWAGGRTGWPGSEVCTWILGESLWLPGGALSPPPRPERGRAELSGEEVRTQGPVLAPATRSGGRCGVLASLAVRPERASRRSVLPTCATLAAAGVPRAAATEPPAAGRLTVGLDPRSQVQPLLGRTKRTRSCERRLAQAGPEVPSQRAGRTSLTPAAPLIGPGAWPGPAGIGRGSGGGGPGAGLGAGSRRRRSAAVQGPCRLHGAAAAPGGPGGRGGGSARGHRRAEPRAARRAQPRDLPPRQVRPSGGGEARGAAARPGGAPGGRWEAPGPLTASLCPAGARTMAAALPRPLAAAG